MVQLIKQAQSEYGKRIVFLRGGVSLMGQKAGSSHTGALAEDSRLLKGIMRQTGAIIVDDFYELTLISKTLSVLIENDIKLPEKLKLGIVTGSGGAGTVMSDLCYEMGIEMPEIQPDVYKQLAELYPDWMPPNKFALADIWPAVEKARGDTGVGLVAADLLLQDPEIQMIILMVFASETWPFSFRTLTKMVKKHKKPVFAYHFGDFHIIEGEKNRLEKYGIPCFYSAKQIIETFYKIAESSKRILENKNTPKA
jgi:acyl-CoA synthetase (NDP forming)